MRDDHGLVLDDKGQWWTECPNSNVKIPEDSKPTICVHCGEAIGNRHETINALTSASELTASVLAEVIHERVKQDKKWGVQDHLPAYWMAILMEEVGEACKDVLEAYPHKHPILKRSEALRMWRKEMIQVAAVAVAAIECHERNKEFV